MEDRVYTDEELRGAFSGLLGNQYGKENLDVFLLARKTYFSDPTAEHSAEAKMAYADTYEDVKLAVHTKKIKEADFYRLTRMMSYLG